MYVDGFNLYYGVLKNTAYKWLDLERFFKPLRPQDDIQAINYFTAIVETVATPAPGRFWRFRTETDGMVSGRRTTVY